MQQYVPLLGPSHMLIYILTNNCTQLIFSNNNVDQRFLAQRHILLLASRNGKRSSGQTLH